MGQATANAVANVVNAAFASAGLASLMTLGTSMSKVGLRDLRQANLAEFLGANVSSAGSAAGESTGNQTALCVTLRTALAGKRYRGRTYLPFNAASALDEDIHQYTAGAVTAGKKFLDDIISGLAGDATLAGNFRLAVISREALAATLVVSTVVRSNLVTTQRRRLPKRG